MPDGATADGGTCDITGQAVTCALDFVIPETLGSPDQPIEPRVVTIVGSVAPGIVGSAAHEHRVVAAAGDPDGAVATTTDPIDRQAAVTVVKIPEQATFTAGGEVAYEVAISNAGPSSATTATLDRPVAGRHHVRSGRIGPPLRRRQPARSRAPGIDRSRHDRHGPHRRDARSVVQGTDIVNTATFTSAANPTPVTSGPVTTPVEQSADLHAIKIATGDAVAAGTAAEFTITIDQHRALDGTRRRVQRRRCPPA